MWIIVQIEHGRILHCDKCGLTIDRDINASYRKEIGHG
jgi:transposase